MGPKRLFYFYVHGLLWVIAVDGNTFPVQFKVESVPSGQFQTARVLEGVKNYQSCTRVCVQRAQIEGYDRNVCRTFYHSHDTAQCRFGTVDPGLSNAGDKVQVMTVEKSKQSFATKPRT